VLWVAENQGMSRKPREVHPDLPHHVILRGNNRRRLFTRANDYTHFIGFLGEALDRHGVALHGLTLMSNHVHAILRPPDADALARTIKSAAQRFAVHRNREHDGSGKLFEQRYFCAAVTTDEYLARVTCYNDLNAVRAGVVDDPFDFRWSTYALHAGQPRRSAVPEDIWTPSPWYLALGSSSDERSAHYAEAAWAYVTHALPDRHAAIAAAAEAMSMQRAQRPRLRPDRTRAD
jgi:putative transposase